MKSAVLPLACALLPALLPAQISYSNWASVSAVQTALPSEGPASARINPAALADVHRASLAYGHSSSLSGKNKSDFLQLAAGIPWNPEQLPMDLAAGFGYMINGSRLDGTNAVYQESEYDPALAARFQFLPEGSLQLAAGISFDIIAFNAFNAVHSTSLGIDAGASASYGYGTLGRIGVGFVHHYLKSPKARLPDDAGDYKIPGWKEYSCEWSSFTHLLRFRIGLFADEDGVPADGPNWKGQVGVNDWEAEVRPISWFALKAERTRSTEMSNLGAVFYPPLDFAHCDGRIELNVAHSGFGATAIPSPFRQILVLDKSWDSGLGWLIGLSLSAEI